VPDQLRGDLLAVLREALSNVVRHAQASMVRVEVKVAPGRLTVTVADDGVGIPTKARRSGLSNLAGRAKGFGGTFTTRRNTPRGTIVGWSVPL
jgi:signal transduction histidine kinase